MMVRARTGNIPKSNVSSNGAVVELPNKRSAGETVSDAANTSQHIKEIERYSKFSAETGSSVGGSVIVISFEASEEEPGNSFLNSSLLYTHDCSIN